MKKIKNFGIGTDIETIDRFRRLDYIENNAFLNRIFTQNELDYCFSKKNAVPHLAARFVGKESIVKALNNIGKFDINYKEIEKSMITYDNQSYLDKNSFDKYKRIVEHSFTTRILGSAVYDFSLIASAKIGARIWNNTKIFDFAAGITIVKEANGMVTDFNGNKITMDSKKIITSNGRIHNDLINIFEKKNGGA